MARADDLADSVGKATAGPEWVWPEATAPELV